MCQVVRLAGIEPTALRLEGESSTNVSYKRWWTRLDSNQRHLGLQPSATTSELQVHVVRVVGFEPTLSGF